MHCAGVPATTGLCAAFALVAFCGLASGGCSSPPSRLLPKDNGWMPVKPYVDTFFVAQSPEMVSRALYDVLDETGAMVIAADKSHELISWCDRSGLFHRLIRDRAQRPGPYGLQGIMAPKPLQFHGVVYACARLKAHGDGTYLKLRAKLRDERPWVLDISNGDYERYIFRRLGTQLRRIPESATKSNRDSLAGLPGNMSGTSPTLGTSEVDLETSKRRQPQASYGPLYFRHFSSLRLPTAQEIRTVGQHEVYPVPVSVFWEACLDVLCQYDAVVALDSTQRIVVISQGMSLPVDKEANLVARYYNALIAILAKARGNTGTDVYVAWLPPGTLLASAIKPLECSTTEELERVARAHPHRATAARVSRQLRDHISTQLFWRDWIPKLSVRRSSKVPAIK